MTDQNQNSFEDTEHDVFDDNEAQASTSEITEEEVSQSTEETSEETSAEKPSEDETGEDQAGPPPEEKDQDENQSGKMIPEHRFKAALKDVNDKLDAANAKIAELSATPVPDKNEDPEGYNFHIRMETSKAVMRETTSDYDQVIAHYQKMAEANPFINEAVAAHPSPAKHAYDIAKKDMEMQELVALKSSDEWNEFQQFKANKAKEAAEKAAKEAAEKANKPKTPNVPNLNRATDVGQDRSPQVDDNEELFAGAL